MTSAAWTALAIAVAFAVGNWIAVAVRIKPLEYICKPTVMIALIGVALALVPNNETQRWAFVVALAFSMLGDVFLMLPGDRFVPGVASFFGAHLAYIVGLRADDASVGGLLVGAALVAAFAATVGRQVLIGVRAKAPEFSTPVAAYIAVISVMVACAIATRDPIAIAGAVVFMASDTLIAWNRFVQPLVWAPVAIMVTYHAGQAALVLSLVQR